MRLFFALPFPEAAPAQALLRARLPDLEARWPRPEGLHLTLAFLGEHPPERLPLLKELGEAAAQGRPPFSLATGPLGGFPKDAAARILWLGLQPSQELLALATALRTGLSAAGVSFDAKPFRPHITLARPRTALAVPDLGPGPDPLAIPVGALCLYQSLSEAGGPRYEVLERFPLRA